MTTLRPEYVFVKRPDGSTGTALQKEGNRYWRSAGAWSINVKEEGGRLIPTSFHGEDHSTPKIFPFKDCELVPCTKEEHAADNARPFENH